MNIRPVGKWRAAMSSLVLTAALAAVPVARGTEMIVTSEVPTSHWKTKYLNAFAEDVKRRTNGALTVKVFPGATLYNDQDAMAALGTGAVHMVWPLAVRLETVAPQTGIVNLPFALTDAGMENSCFSSGLTKMISSYVEPRNLEVMAFLRTADLMYIFKNREVQKLEDLKGTKIRVTGGKVFLDMIRSLNASPVSLPASEMSTAISQGAIDGVLSSPAGWANIIGITAKYGWYVPGMSLGTYAVLVDKPWFEKLPAEQRKAISDSIAEIAQRQWKEAIEEDKVLIKKMVSQGAVFHTASAPELQRWKSLATGGNKAFMEKYPEAAARFAALEKSCGLAK